jgi:hypothetical protein
MTACAKDCARWPPCMLTHRRRFACGIEHLFSYRLPTNLVASKRTSSWSQAARPPSDWRLEWSPSPTCSRKRLRRECVSVALRVRCRGRPTSPAERPCASRCGFGRRPPCSRPGTFSPSEGRHRRHRGCARRHNARHVGCTLPAHRGPDCRRRAHGRTPAASRSPGGGRPPRRLHAHPAPAGRASGGAFPAHRARTSIQPGATGPADPSRLAWPTACDPRP